MDSTAWTARQPGTAQHSSLWQRRQHSIKWHTPWGPGGSVAHRQSTAITGNTAVLHAQLHNAGQLYRQGSSVVVHGNSSVTNKRHAHCYHAPAPNQHCDCKVGLSRDTCAQSKNAHQHNTEADQRRALRLSTPTAPQGTCRSLPQGLDYLHICSHALKPRT